MTIFYTIVFSLSKPENNQYFYMMMMLYKTLVRTESIGQGDRFFVVADPITIAYRAAVSSGTHTLVLYASADADGVAVGTQVDIWGTGNLAP